jgi:ABC-type multidrug transport system fused ATPase/permease subunit
LSDSTRASEKGTSLKKGRSNLLFLLRYYKPFSGRVTAAVLIGLPVSAISLAFPALTGDLVDSIIASESTKRLTEVGLIFLGLLAVQAIIGYFVSVTLAKTTERVIASLRADLFTHIIRLPLSYLSQRRVGELTSRLSSDLTQIQETFSFSILQLLRQGIFLVGSLIIIITTSLPLTIPIVVGTPVIVGIAMVIGRRIRKLSTRTQDALARTSTIVEETLQSISAVKSFVQESHETQRYKDALTENVHLAIQGARLRALFVTFIIFTIFGGIAAVILYGANLVAEGSVSMGELLSFLMYAMFVGGALGSFAEVIGQIQKTLGATERLKELLEQEKETSLHSAHDLHDVATPERRLHSVEFDNVSFTYRDHESASVLNAISFHLHRGERIAFVGSSGAGKSTTAALIQRLYEASSGTIRYDGIDAKSLSIQEVRRSVGIVPQDIVLFGGTIEENIRYGNLLATHDEVRLAAERANALEFIERQPEGFETVVGERGIKLSGGQRQRVAIARAILKDPPILILDEATSALDADSERLIKDALSYLMKGRTTVIIAHRLSTVRECDRILVFEEGRIVEEGSHDELLAKGGRYAHWCDLQFIS